MKRRVVVTGLGVVTALGCRAEDLWTRICDGQSGVRPFSRFDSSRFRVRFGGEITDWSPDGYVNSKEAKRLDRFCQFALVAGIDAVKASGLEFDREDTFRCGVIIGSGIFFLPAVLHRAAGADGRHGQLRPHVPHHERAGNPGL